jgi:putative holliday junction resolvase
LEKAPVDPRESVVVLWIAKKKMPRFLGIDYGEKRIGLSVGDELGFASPIAAAVGRTKVDRLKQIEEVIRARGIAALVVGHPLNMDGSSGFKAQEVERFVLLLQERFGLPVHLVDERLTSFEAEARFKSRGKKVIRASGEVDSMAAALILQDFLDQKYPPLAPEPEDD